MKLLSRIVMSLLLFVPTISFSITVKDVAHTLSSFEPSNGEGVRIDYVIDQAAYVELAIFDGRDLMIRKISSTKLEQAGQHSFVWDGRDNAGRLVPPEAYHYTLTAYTRDGDKITFDPTDLTSGESVAVEDITWDGASKTIKFRLRENARVSVRIGLRDNGPVLRTLLNWSPRLHGVNTIAWDGRDESGAIEISDEPRRAFSIKAFKLSVNTILVGPETNKVTLISDITWPKVKRVAQQKIKPHEYTQSQQKIEQRSDFPVIITLPTGLKRAADGTIILTGRTAIHIDLLEADLYNVFSQRFESAIYLNGEFLQETEMGTIPMTWYWEPGDLKPGTHYLTANISTYTGRFGTYTVKFIYRPANT